MPNRIIKESIKKSPTIDQLSWFEEVIFYRIIVTADDYGRLDGRVTVLKNELFPTKESITKKNIEDALGKLVSTGLVCRYEANGIPYLYLPTWESHQQIRAKKSKFPSPDISCNQMISDEIKCHRNPIQSESESESSSSAEPPSGKFPDDSDEMKLCLLLAERMRRNKPDCKLPDNFNSWCRHIDLMIRIDGRTPKQIQDVILFCQKDAFWQSVILSTKKLREKFDQLSMKMQAPTKGKSNALSGEASYDITELEKLIDRGVY